MLSRAEESPTPQPISTVATDVTRPASAHELFRKDVISTAATTSIVAESSHLYTVVSQVGRGAFGTVYKVRRQGYDALFAVKQMRYIQGPEEYELPEITLLPNLSHPNVVRLYDTFVSDGQSISTSRLFIIPENRATGRQSLVFEYMEHDLRGILWQTSFALSDAHLKSLCTQMFLGIDYVHEHGIMHRDLKSCNILVNSRGELKLADFGISCAFKKGWKIEDPIMVCTLGYRPPELLLGATIYGPEVDMWSAG